MLLSDNINYIAIVTFSSLVTSLSVMTESQTITEMLLFAHIRVICARTVPAARLGVGTY